MSMKLTTISDELSTLIDSKPQTTTTLQIHPRYNMTNR